MCGRFINLNKVEKLNKIFATKKLANTKDNISYNIAPSQSSLIITNLKDSYNIENACWGFKFIDKNTQIEKNIINSRLETIREKIIFKESFEERRCIIPVNGYYEWLRKDNIKTPYFIHMPMLDSFYFAGIWKYFNSKINKSKIFSIITKTAINSLVEIHKRMPITLSLNEAIQYLDPVNPDYLDINFNSLIENELTFYKISKFVNNPINNSKDCIEAIN